MRILLATIGMLVLVGGGCVGSEKDSSVLNLDLSSFNKTTSNQDADASELFVRAIQIFEEEGLVVDLESSDMSIYDEVLFGQSEDYGRILVLRRWNSIEEYIDRVRTGSAVPGDLSIDKYHVNQEIYAIEFASDIGLDEIVFFASIDAGVIAFSGIKSQEPIMRRILSKLSGVPLDYEGDLPTDNIIRSLAFPKDWGNVSYSTELEGFDQGKRLTFTFEKKTDIVIRLLSDNYREGIVEGFPYEFNSKVDFRREKSLLRMFDYMSIDYLDEMILDQRMFVVENNKIPALLIKSLYNESHRSVNYYFNDFNLEGYSAAIISMEAPESTSKIEELLNYEANNIVVDFYKKFHFESSREHTRNLIWDIVAKLDTPEGWGEPKIEEALGEGQIGSGWSIYWPQSDEATGYFFFHTPNFSYALQEGFPSFFNGYADFSSGMPDLISELFFGRAPSYWKQIVKDIQYVNQNELRILINMSYAPEPRSGLIMLKNSGVGELSNVTIGIGAKDLTDVVEEAIDEDEILLMKSILEGIS